MHKTITAVRIMTKLSSSTRPTFNVVVSPYSCGMKDHDAARCGLSTGLQIHFELSLTPMTRVMRQVSRPSRPIRHQSPIRRA